MKKGSHHLKETIEKISKTMRGKHHTTEAKRKMSRSKKGENHPMFGKQHSKETREKMCKSHKDKHHSKETREKISLNHADLGGKNHPMYGKHHSKKTIEKISGSKMGKNNPNFGKDHKGENNPNFGKRFSIESKEKISKSKMGENNPSWKGGISFLPYCQKFNEKFKESIREEFNRECFICGLSEELNERKLPVHHINYNKNCLCDDSKCYFIPLCNSCHSITNYNREFWEKLLTDCCEDPYTLAYFGSSETDIFRDFKVNLEEIEKELNEGGKIKC